MANTNKTFDELIAAVKTEMQLDPGLISDDERKRFINDCLSDIGLNVQMEKEVLLDCAPGGIALPDDFVDLLYVSFDGRRLRPLEYVANPISGNPVGYTLSGGKLYLNPAPSTGQVAVLYTYKPQALVASSDKPDIPNGYDSMIVDFAVSKCYRKNGNIGIFREYMSMYEERKYQLAAEMARRANQRVVVPHNVEYTSTPNRFGGEEIIF